MITSVELLLAFLVDQIVGDPKKLLHPVQIMGKLIEKTEALLRKVCSSPEDERSAGVVLAAVVVIPSYAVTWLVVEMLRSMPGKFFEVVGVLLIIWLASTALALRGLCSSAQDVIDELAKGDILNARKKLSMIVGRDTDQLSEKEIQKAVIETVSENLSDGVVAPLFYLALGGLPFAMAYKAVNTLDSMVGYKNDKYRDFGFASAKLDDILNYIPARISGLLIVSAVFILKLFSSNSLSSSNAYKIMKRDGRKHPSPNSGISEAAMAGALGVQLGGPSRYSGILVEKEHIGDEIETDYAAAGIASISIIKAASLIAVIISAIILAMRFGS